MKYVSFIWADGMPTPKVLAALQRELPAWAEEVDRRGVRLFGRELDLPETAVTVRMRDGEKLVTDGPFAETKEFVAGFDLNECADLDEAIEVAAKCPISWFQAIEIRPFTEGLRLDERAFAFGRSEDGGASPYLLSMWTDRAPASQWDDQTVMDKGEAWRQEVQARGMLVFGNPLGGPETATTVRVRDGQTLLNGPSGETGAFIGGIEVVSCASREEAIHLAATHPLARSHAIEVRPFYSE